MLNSISTWFNGLILYVQGLSTFTQALSVALATFLFLAIQTLRSRKKLSLPPIKSDKKPHALFKLAGGKVLAWLLQFFKDTKTLFTQSEDLYKTPWILILGEEKSGTSSIAESLRKSNKFNSLLRDNPLVRQEQGWWPFDKGMLIDLQGLIRRSSRKEVVEEFMRLRPERPFDGVVVCISAEQLADGNEQQLSDRGVVIHDQLTRLQQEFAFTFPVYVVITKSDLIPGFSEFWRAQDKEDFQARLREMFGWSNPSSLEAGYSAQWLEDGFEEMQNALRVEQLRVSAEGSDSYHKELDNFFLFPAKFRALKAPVKKVFERVFTVNAYQANFFLRGLYFTGKVLDDTEGPLVDAMDETPVSFIESLFSSKIFAERHLARPIREGIWSRQQQIQRLQKMILGGAAFVFVGLIIASIALKSRVDEIELMLNRVSHQTEKSNLDRHTCVDFDVVTDTLGSLGSVSSSIGSTFIPMSWFAASLEGSIFGFLSDAVMEDLVVDAMKCQIEKREQSLAGFVDSNAGVPTKIEEVEGVATDVEAYLNEVIELNNTITQWQSLAMASEGKNKYIQLGKLFYSVYDQEIPATVNNNRSAIINVFDHSVIPNYETSDDLKRQIASNIRGQLTHLGGMTTQILQRGADIVDQYNELAIDSGQSGQSGDLADLQLEQVTFLAEWIDWVDQSWLPTSVEPGVTTCEKAAEQLDSELTAMSTMTLGGPFGTELAILPPDWSGCRAKARAQLAGVNMAPIDSMLVSVDVGSDATTNHAGTVPLQRVSPKWKQEATRLSALADLGFMAASGGEFSCKSDAVRWDNTILQQMLQRMAELAEYAPSGLSDGTQYPHEKIAKRHLASVLNALATDAQQYSYTTAVYRPKNSKTPSLSALRQGSEDFVQSSTNLAEVLRRYIDLGMSDEGADIATCAKNFAVGQLDKLKIFSNATGVLNPTENTKAYRDPSQSLFLFEGGDSPENWWSIEEGAAKDIVGYSSPYVSFLESSQQTYGLSGTQTAEWYYWNSTVIAQNEFDAGSNKGQVGALKAMFTAVSGMNADNCASKIENLPELALGMDLFSTRRQIYDDLSHSFCTAEAVAAGSSVYSTLDEDFNGLEQSFPFADSSVSKEATLTATRNFFLDFAAESDTFDHYLSANQSAVDKASNTLLLNQLNGGVQFFNSHLAVEGTPEALDLSVVFRPDQTTNSEQTDGSRDVVLWMMSNGIDIAKRPQGQNSLSWFYGQPLSFSFSWAADGHISPVRDASQSHMSVDDATKTATFSFIGTWALQRLIAGHWYSGPDAGTTAPKTLRLKFDVPITSDSAVNADNKDASGSANAATASSTTPMAVSLYVDMNVTTLSSSGEAVPVFVPQALPQTFPKVSASSSNN